MNKNLLSTSVAGLLVLAALTGCTTTQEEYHYVNLSQVACTFQGENNQPLTVSVITAPAAWSAIPEASWVTAEKGEDGESLIINVADNTTESERETRITVSAGEAEQQIRISQLAQDNGFSRYRRINTFSKKTGVMSPNGKYIGGFITTIAPDDSYLHAPAILDTDTEEIYEFGPYPEALYSLYQPTAITDQGLLFISDGYHGGQIAIDLDGDIFKPEAPAGYKGAPAVSASSSDGKYWVGYALEASIHEGLTKPLLWIDGVPHELPLPDKNFRDEEFIIGAMARGISANGEIIYGTSWDNADTGMMYWVNRGTDTEKPRWVGEDVRVVTPVILETPDGVKHDYHIANGLICAAERTKISPSGRWIASSYRTEEIAEDKHTIRTTQTAAFYNTETETTTIVDDYGESTGRYVTDDGIAFIGLGSANITSSRVYDLNTHTDLGSMEDWIYENYGIIIPGGSITYVSPDGKYMLGTIMEMGAIGGPQFVSWYIAPPTAK